MYTAQKMTFSSKGFLSKCDQIRSFLRIWSHFLKKSLMENFIFCAVLDHLWGSFQLPQKRLHSLCHHYLTYLPVTDSYSYNWIKIIFIKKLSICIAILKKVDAELLRPHRIRCIWFKDIEILRYPTSLRERFNPTFVSTGLFISPTNTALKQNSNNN